MAAILIAGGAGYVGSHTAVKLLEQDVDVVIADDFSNSNAAVIQAIEAILVRRSKTMKSILLKKKRSERYSMRMTFQVSLILPDINR